MKNGQISLDFLITILVIIITLGGLTLISENILTMQEEVFIENQVRTIGTNIELAITTSQSMNDTNFISKISIDKIIYKNSKYSPIIEINNNELSINSNSPQKNIEYTNTISYPKNLRIEINDDFLVIKNV